MKTRFVLVLALAMPTAFRGAQTPVPEFDRPSPASLGKTAAGDRADVRRPANLAPQPWFVDEHQRHFIPNGVVLLTEDSEGDFEYPESAFTRMRGYGFNLQVVRLSITRLGGWPGAALEPGYLEKLDRMVRLGAENGVKTVFKLTLYDFAGKAYRQLTNVQWATLFLNEGGAQERYLAAWELLFRRYASNLNVWGYDLLNEPLAGWAQEKKYIWEEHPELKDREDFERKRFWPLYERVIDRLHEISPDKWALVQSWHYRPADHRRIGLPSAPPVRPLARARTAFAPHYYGDRPAFALDAYLKGAATLGVPMLMGEYGPPTFRVTDTSLPDQLAYELNFMRTVSWFDRNAIGMCKAWWTGSRPFEAKHADRTWALFTGPDAVSGPERKYILDLMCRPRPLAIAGVIDTYGFDFATRHFHLQFKPGSASAPSEIYLPRDRMYLADGVRITFGRLVLVLPAAHDTLEVLENPDHVDPSAFSFDPTWQRLRVTRWPAAASATAVLEFAPGASR